MSLIPSESENFPESFRRKVGWHISQQPEDPNAVEAAQRMAAALPSAPPAQASPPAAEAGGEQPVEPPAGGTTENISPEASSPPAEYSTGNLVPTEEVIATPLPAASTNPAAAEPMETEPTAENPTNITVPTPDVPAAASNKSSGPALPKVMVSEIAGLANPDTLQSELLQGPPISKDTPAAPAAETAGMTALVSQFLSSGVPIFVEQPSGEPPAPVPAPAPAVRPQRSGFLISTDALPAIDEPPTAVSPTDSLPPRPAKAAVPPAIEPAKPVSPPESKPAQQPAAEQPIDLAPIVTAEPLATEKPAQVDQSQQSFVTAAPNDPAQPTQTNSDPAPRLESSQPVTMPEESPWAGLITDQLIDPSPAAAGGVYPETPSQNDEIWKFLAAAAGASLPPQNVPAVAPVSEPSPPVTAPKGNPVKQLITNQPIELLPAAAGPIFDEIPCPSDLLFPSVPATSPPNDILLSTPEGLDVAPASEPSATPPEDDVFSEFVSADATDIPPAVTDESVHPETASQTDEIFEFLSAVAPNDAPLSTPGGLDIAPGSELSAISPEDDLFSEIVSDDSTDIPPAVADESVHPETASQSDEIFQFLAGVAATEAALRPQTNRPVAPAPQPGGEVEVAQNKPAKEPASGPLSDVAPAATTESVSIPTQAQADQIFELLTAARAKDASTPTQNVEPAPAPEPCPSVIAPEDEPAQKPVSGHLSDVASAAATESAPLGTRGQAEQILQMIAAAVQRGDLGGGPTAGATVPAVEKPTASSPSIEPAPPTVRQSAAISSPVEPMENFSPEAGLITGDASPEAVRPAKIRITPRKIKPRSEPETQPDNSAEPFNDSTNNGVTEESDGPRPKAEPTLQVAPPAADPGSAKLTTPPKPQAAAAKPVAPAKAQAQPVKSVAPPAKVEPPKVQPFHPLPFERRVQAARKSAAMRREIAQSDLLMFSARERRNRWISFGICELAAVASLILLGNFGLNHHFPDPTVKVLVFILLFAAAAIAVALPIAFLRNDPARWGREP